MATGKSGKYKHYQQKEIIKQIQLQTATFLTQTALVLCMPLGCLCFNIDFTNDICFQMVISLYLRCKFKPFCPSAIWQATNEINLLV